MTPSHVNSIVDRFLPRSVATAPATAVPIEQTVLALFDRCAPSLQRYVASFGLGAEETEDIVQDVFLSLFRHLRLGRSRSNLKGWLFQVAHNRALKHRGRTRRRQAQACRAAVRVGVGHRLALGAGAAPAFSRPADGPLID